MIYILISIILIFASLSYFKSKKDQEPNWDWCGKKQKKFRLSTFKFEYGRRCWEINAFGDNIRTGWKWENSNPK